MFISAIIQVIQDTIENLCTEYKYMMTNLAYSILKDYQYAEDAVQESLLILSKNMNKMDSIYSDRSKNYIYTVTKNEALSLNQKIRNKNDKVVQFYDEEEVNNIEGDLDINAFCNEYGFGDDILEVLSELDEIDKDILIYKYGADYSVKEIAKLMNKNPDYIYKRLQRVIKKMQKILKEGKK